MADKITKFLPYNIEGFDAVTKTLSVARISPPGAKIQAPADSNIERLIFTGANSSVDLHMTNFLSTPMMECTLPIWFLMNNLGAVVNCLFRSSPSGVVIADDMKIVP
ncbi:MULTISPECIES: hypothetical protein [unclassified Pseudomonas]|jgi:hypothetical protein|uniref:hypothetical protein n=1 Tax=unclassified Pseudomonas TaxID=196821 RepID=UPI001C882BE2|nr:MULTISPECIES: hypothetical protein [unclassified Pseudomonas]MBX8467999.1 hypothetical protein [Pseudomonas sp. RIT778]UVM29699.1 hypothetical protein LOY31_11695 [Pseudomonas sp. B21-021]